MQLKYTVHSVVTEPVVVQATMGDREVSATVPGLTVELVGVGSNAAGHTFRFVPVGDDEMAAHQDLFAVGNEIVVDFSTGSHSN